MANPEERRWRIYRHVFENCKSYIGQIYQELNARWGKHGTGYLQKNDDGTYKQPLMARAILKYGWDSVTSEILFDNLTFEEANRIEQICIALFRTRDPRFGYNLTDGGGGSHGRAVSEETKHKIGEKAKERLSDPTRAYWYGKKLPPEAIEKRRLKNIGRKHIEEAKRKMSESRMGIFRGENGTTSEPVICLDACMYFGCIQDAGNFFGISRSCVGKASRGEILQ